MTEHKRATIKIASEESHSYMIRELVGYASIPEGLIITIEHSQEVENWLESFGDYGCFHLFSFEFEFSNEVTPMAFTGYILEGRNDPQGTVSLRLKFNTKVDIH